jgi:hypothetical protein
VNFRTISDFRKLHLKELQQLFVQFSLRGIEKIRGEWAIILRNKPVASTLLGEGL